MKAAILEVIGALVMAIVILGTPVLSFVSFIHNWNGFIVMSLLLGLVVDFLYVLEMLLIGEKE